MQQPPGLNNQTTAVPKTAVPWMGGGDSLISSGFCLSPLERDSFILLLILRQRSIWNNPVSKSRLCNDSVAVFCSVRGRKSLRRTKGSCWRKATSSDTRPNWNNNKWVCVYKGVWPLLDINTINILGLNIFSSFVGKAILVLVSPMSNNSFWLVRVERCVQDITLNVR